MLNLYRGSRLPIPFRFPVRHISRIPTFPKNILRQEEKFPVEKKKENAIIAGFKHYYNGAKLFIYETRLSIKYATRLAKGETLSRREHLQLRRSFGDVLRLGPFMVFVIVPFLEFAIPFAVKVFPNLLPSTFEDKLLKEETLKKQLKAKLEVAKFLQSVVKDLSVQQNEAASSFDDLFSKDQCRATGQPITTEELVKVCKMFGDELTLDNLNRTQLVSMCRYLNIRPYGTDNFLRYLFINKIKKLKKDDKLILAEGVDSLTISELQNACQERGIRFLGYSPARMKMELSQWLELHLKHEIPFTLIVLSRAFTIDGSISDPSEALRATVSTLPEDVVSQVAAQHTNDPKQIMDAVAHQEKKIIEEREIEDLRKQDEIANQQEYFEQDLSEQQQEELTEAIEIMTHPPSSKVKEEIDELCETQKSVPPSSLASRVDKLLLKLGDEFNKYDKTVGSRLNLVLANEKGEITVEQLENVLTMIKQNSNEAKIKEIVAKLDKDDDGYVLIQDLLKLNEDMKAGKSEK